ncbi:MAG: hypothetical protein ACYDHC_14640 [Desulfuromonadaceae bacterium]
MKKVLTMVVVAMVALSFSMVAVAAEEKPADKAAAEKAEKAEKKDAKKDAKKDTKAKPAVKGKKELSGC